MADPLRRSALEHFHELALSQVGRARVPGLVALLAHRGQVHVEVLGELDLGGRPVQRDSLFRISSMTKPLTGAATMVLVEAGLLQIDETVDRLLPELSRRRVLRRPDGPLADTVEATRAITVRDLLSFGFGVAAEMFQAKTPWPIMQAANRLPLATLGPPQPEAQADPDRWIAALGSLPLIAQPGQRWLYNTGASVLGVLLARASGQTLQEVLRQRLLGPLGMRDTAFFASQPGRLATAYRPGPEGLEIWDAPGGAWSHPPAFADGAAGLVSTADDLLAFARALLRGGAPVLSPASVAEMSRDQVSAAQLGSAARTLLRGRSWGFCQAVVTEGPRAGAFGWDGGLGSSLLVDPGRDLVVIVLSQRMFESPAPPPLHSELQTAAYGAIAESR